MCFLSYLSRLIGFSFIASHISWDISRQRLSQVNARCCSTNEKAWKLLRFANLTFDLLYHSSLCPEKKEKNFHVIAWQEKNNENWLRSLRVRNSDSSIDNMLRSPYSQFLLASGNLDLLFVNEKSHFFYAESVQVYQHQTFFLSPCIEQTIHKSFSPRKLLSHLNIHRGKKFR